MPKNHKTTNLADSATVNLQQSKASILAALDRTLDQSTISALRDAITHLVRVEEYLNRIGQMDSDEAERLQAKIRALNRQATRQQSEHETHRAKVDQRLDELMSEVRLLRQIMERSDLWKEILESIDAPLTK